MAQHYGTSRVPLLAQAQSISALAIANSPRFMSPSLGGRCIMDPVSQIITRKEWHLALLRTCYTLGNPLQCYFSLMMLLPGISGHAEQTVPHHPVFALLESGPMLPCSNAQNLASTGRLLLCRTAAAGGPSRSRSDLPLSTSAEQITRCP